MVQKYNDGLMGFVVGNALGLPLEGEDREQLLSKPVTKMIGMGTHNVAEGTWGDETSLMIATIDSINNKNDVVIDDIAFNFVAYKNHGTYTPFNEAFGLDKMTRKAIERYDEERLEPTLCGNKEIESNSAIVLARILPIAYFAVAKKLKDFEVLEIVSDVCKITHQHDISVLACYIYVRFIMFLLNGKDKYSAYSMTKCVDYTMFSEDIVKCFDRLLVEDIGKLKVNEIKSSNNVVDVLEASIWLLIQSNSYKEALIGAINLGESTDVIAALTGALAGISYGYDEIPVEWIDNITRKEYILDIFEEFSENKYE